MASPSELTLDYKPNTNTTSYPLIQKAFGDQPEPTSQIKLQDFLAHLEEERHKIEAFKRELPLCMQLLNNAMETYRRQLETYQNNSNHGPRAELEEFIPFSNMSINCGEKSATPTSEKANWMVSAQLWSPVTTTEPTHTKLALDTKQRNGGSGAFLPFSKEKTGSEGFGPGPRALPELALAAPAEKEEVEEKKCEVGSNGVLMAISKGAVGGVSDSKGGSNGNEGQPSAAGGQSAHRKARRCWSPDLHRRFVNALQMLGGSQVATPKQIRELMKVDGLTNDEVKSHLQKYRLHTRRPIQAPQPPATAAPQLVVLGGIWVPPEYASAAAAAAAAGGPTVYPTVHTAAHYPVTHHDFYAAAAPPPPWTQHHLHRAAAVAGPYGRAEVPAHSPESELRSSGDRSESIEDGDEGEEEVDDDEQDLQEEEMEEAKAEDRALVPVEGSGNVGEVALKF